MRPSSAHPRVVDSCPRFSVGAMTYPAVLHNFQLPLTKVRSVHSSATVTSPHSLTSQQRPLSPTKTLSRSSVFNPSTPVHDPVKFHPRYESLPSFAAVSVRSMPSDESLVAFINSQKQVEMVEISVELEGGSHLSDAALVKIAELGDKVVSLVLAGCVQLTVPSLQTIFRACPNIRKVDVSKCSLLSDSVLGLALERLPMLESMSFAECRGITGASVRTLMMRDPETNPLPKGLRSVSFAFCAGFAHAGWLAKCSKLEAVDFSGCTSLTTEDLTMITTTLSSLRSLSLRICSQPTLSLDCLKTLGRKNPKLRSLCLAGCTAVNDALLQDVWKPCAEELTFVDLSGCPSIGDGTLFHMSDAGCRRLECLLLTATKCTQSGILLLLKKLGNVSIKRLELSSTGLTIEDVNAVREQYPHVDIQFQMKEIIVPKMFAAGKKAEPKGKKKGGKDGKKKKK